LQGNLQKNVSACLRNISIEYFEKFDVKILDPLQTIPINIPNMFIRVDWFFLKRHFAGMATF
jgi:hypothetical protein